MTQYIIRKLLTVIPTILFLTSVIFVLLYTLLGDPVVIMLGRDADPETIARLREALGFNRPIIVQYWDWLTHLLRGQWGVSYRTSQPVAEVIVSRLPVTVELTFLAMLMAVVGALVSAVVAATHPNSRIDLLVSFLSAFGLAMPLFLVGIVLILVFGLKLGWLPSSGYTPFLESPFANLKTMILPSITLSLTYYGTLTRIARNELLEVLGSDYIRTARAKGLKEQTVLGGHAMRNATLPVLTILGVQVGRLFGGAVVTETVFALPGVGRLLINSILGRDFTVVQGIIVVITVAVLLTSLIVDVAYTWLDPRIRLS